MFARAQAFVIAALCVAACLSGSLTAQAAKVGVAAAVKNDVEGVQSGTSRELAAGSSIFENELVRTGTDSVAQLLFLDETTLSIGPRSEVVLDRFVYDPNTGNGDVLLTATKGAFRFISGSQNPLSYKIDTPVATIGVRGTIVDCAIGSLTCVVQEGSAIIEFDGVSYQLEPGEALTVGDDGTVTGPYTHDGVFDAVASGTPWPLYGGSPPTETWHFEVPDNATVRIDDIVQPDPPPPEDDEECIYECECVSFC